MPAAVSARTRSRQLGGHFLDDVGVDRLVLHVDALAAPVHDDVRHPSLGDQAGHPRVGQAAAHVVDQPRPGADGLLGDPDAHGVDADDHARLRPAP